MSRLEEANDFIYNICGCSFPFVNKIVEDNKDVVIFIEEDDNESDEENPIYSLCVKNSINTYKTAIPKLPYSIFLSSFFAYRAASAQKIIDTCIEVLKDSILIAEKKFGADFTVEIRNTCIYKYNMMWFNYKDTSHYYVHPYLKEHHPNAYKEIKEEFSDCTEDEILENF